MVFRDLARFQSSGDTGAAGRRRTAAPPTRSGPEGSSRNGLRTGRRPVCTFHRIRNLPSAPLRRRARAPARGWFAMVCAQIRERALGLIRVLLAMAVLFGHLPILENVH